MIDLDKIVVIGDKVLIKPEDDMQKTNSGLFLPPGIKEKESVHGGYVVKTGPGYPFAAPSEDEEPWKTGSQGNKYISLQARNGDFALYLKKDSIDVEIDGGKFVIVPHAAILLLKRDDLF